MARISYTEGNLLEADADAVINTVNCVGVMGKGIALQFKQAYPANFAEYLAACRKKTLVPGVLLTHRTGRLNNPKYIINFPTKRHWKGHSRIDDIRIGLDALVDEVKKLDITSIAIPALGCGNGGLDWDKVRPMIEDSLRDLNVDALIYPPQEPPKPEHQLVGTMRTGLTNVRASLILLLKRYQIEGYKHSLLEVQKLAYFLQVAGEPLNLRFGRDKYGPYAENLNFVLQRLEGHYLRGYGDRSRSAEIVLMPGAVDAAEQVLSSPTTRERLNRVAQLIEGYESPYGLELLATAHWIMAENPLAAVDETVAVNEFKRWNARKAKLFKDQHIVSAWRRLKRNRWTDPSIASQRPEDSIQTHE